MNKLELIVFNVGHGLSVALIERPENYVTLVDLGADTNFTPLKHLSLKWNLRPDILYVTHPHADHIDDVETALDRNFGPDGINYQTYDWADVKKRERPELANKIDKFQKLASVVPFKKYEGAANLEAWRFTPENAKKKFGETSYVNNSSLFIVYKWNDFKISICGDLESDGMSAMVDSEKVKSSAQDTCILIPPHHGHSNGFPTHWVSRMGKPYVSIISVQERDPSVDARYRSNAFAEGVQFDGKTRYSLTTRAHGNIVARMWYEGSTPTWEFSSF
jgi:beta-lactamase superfamily II metal-dependent hydrolase